jgi:Trk K+ transport system NAD-binding subunit
VLREAGADDADMLVAVTSSDECNMVACQIAYSLFNVPNKVARIRSHAYLSAREKLFKGEVFHIDHLISPEQLVIEYMRRLIEYPGALQVADFAGGRLGLVAVKAYYGGPLVGNALATLKEHMPNIDTRVAAIFRQGRSIRPQGTTIIEADDEVFFVAASGHIRAVMSELQRLESPYRRIMIVGGGNVGAGLARQLEGRYKGKSIADVLDMTINRAVEFFENVPQILNKIKVLQEVGLGYIKLGQPSTTLSGGESQRVKLATELAKRDTGKTIYILDEPTTGLHFEDIRVLMNVLNRLVEKGNTVIVIEHNLDVIKMADYIIDMGPEGGKAGGQLLVCGTPEEVAQSGKGYTSGFLKEELKGVTK